MATCPNCDSAVEETDQYCRHCGAELHSGQETESYPPEASPMFGGETWTGSTDDAATGERSDATTRGRSKRGTYPPEASPMFGGETWEWATDTNEPSTAADSTDGQSASDSPMAGGATGSRHTTAIRNALIYALGTLAIIAAWYFFL